MKNLIWNQWTPKRCMHRTISSIIIWFILPLTLFYIFKRLLWEAINRFHQTPKGSMAQKWLRTSLWSRWHTLLTSHSHIYPVFLASIINLNTIWNYFIYLFTFHLYTYVLRWNVHFMRAMTLSFLLCTAEPGALSAWYIKSFQYAVNGRLQGNSKKNKQRKWIWEVAG